MSDNDRFYELIDEARRLPDGPTRVALLEEAVREADLSGHEGSAFYARAELVKAATFSGLREKALVAYSWCLAFYDRNRDQFDYSTTYHLLWQYKWIVGQITDYPQITRRQIVEMQDDMERRFADAGFNARPVHYFRHQNALDMGDMEAAMEFRTKWISTPRDALADCEACEADTACDMPFARKQDEEGLKSVEPILRGMLRCSEIPHVTLSKVLVPLARLDRVAEALPLQQRGYRLISKNRDFLPDIARHMLFLTHLQDYNKATRMFARHFPWAYESAVPEFRFRIYLAGAVLFDAVAAKGNRKRKLRLPADFPLKSEDDAYKPDELAAWLWGETRQLARRFNVRNGNDYYTRHIDDARELAGLS